MSILQNAADVLRLYTSGSVDLTVSEVTARLNMPKANVSRLMKAMREAGFLETIGDSRKHRPGRLVLDLAAAFTRSSGVIERAAEVVSAVSQQFGHTGYVSLLEGRQVTGVVDFPGTNTLRVMGAMGRRLHAEHSATGRSLLARLTDDEIREIYADHDEIEQLLGKLNKVRSRGFAFSSQEATPGVDAIAIAVADPATEEAASLCIVYPHAVVSAEDRDKMIAALASGATRLAQELGDTSYVEPTLQKKGNFE